MHAGSQTWYMAHEYVWGVYAGNITHLEDCRMPRSADLIRSLLILI